MATAVIPTRRKQAVPTETPLEAGNYMCSACGSIMTPEPVMGPRAVEAVKYTCKNEDTGCNYELIRKVPATNASMRGIRVEPAK